MDSLATAIAQHGYSILCLVVFLEAIGIPVPAALGLLIAGGSSAQGMLSARDCLGFALSAMLAGDTLMYLIGRLTGWWLLGILCRVSLNPEACILKSADSFYRKGRILLVFAKFIPGINTMAPPLSGSMSMPFAQFFGLDFAAASLYVGVWFGTGFLFSGVLNSILHGYSAFGTVVGWVICGALALWLVWRIALWLRARRERPVDLIRAAELAAAEALVLDVRSHGYYEKGAVRIRGSKRMDPHALRDHVQTLPKDRKIVLYCTCIREATSAAVARTLEDEGLKVSVLEGGFRAWKKAGLPVEAVPGDEVIPLPKFV